MKRKKVIYFLKEKGKKFERPLLVIELEIANVHGT